MTNIGCTNSSEVHVYDTLQPSLPSSTVNTIALLTMCPTRELTIKMIDVDLQKNSSDCGVLYIAHAFELMSKMAPSTAEFDQEQLRNHLCECLGNCCFSSFLQIGQ